MSPAIPQASNASAWKTREQLRTLLQDDSAAEAFVQRKLASGQFKDVEWFGQYVRVYYVPYVDPVPDRPTARKSRAPGTNEKTVTWAMDAKQEAQPKGILQKTGQLADTEKPIVFAPASKAAVCAFFGVPMAPPPPPKSPSMLPPCPQPAATSADAGRSSSTSPSKAPAKHDGQGTRPIATPSRAPTLPKTEAKDAGVKKEPESTTATALALPNAPPVEATATMLAVPNALPCPVADQKTLIVPPKAALAGAASMAAPKQPNLLVPAVASTAVAAPAVAPPTVAPPAVAPPAVAPPAVAPPAIAPPASERGFGGLPQFHVQPGDTWHYRAVLSSC